MGSMHTEYVEQSLTLMGPLQWRTWRYPAPKPENQGLMDFQAVKEKAALRVIRILPPGRIRTKVVSGSWGLVPRSLPPLTSKGHQRNFLLISQPQAFSG